MRTSHFCILICYSRLYWFYKFLQVPLTILNAYLFSFFLWFVYVNIKMRYGNKSWRETHLEALRKLLVNPMNVFCQLQCCGMHFTCSIISILPIHFKPSTLLLSSPIPLKLHESIKAFDATVIFCYKQYCRSRNEKLVITQNFWSWFNTVRPSN